jgi:hypothetical protein
MCLRADRGPRRSRAAARRRRSRRIQSRRAPLSGRRVRRPRRAPGSAGRARARAPRRLPRAPPSAAPGANSSATPSRRRRPYLGRPETDAVRSLTMNVLGTGLFQAGHHEDALTVREAELATMRRLGAAWAALTKVASRAPRPRNAAAEACVTNHPTSRVIYIRAERNSYSQFGPSSNRQKTGFAGKNAPPALRPN